MNVHRYVWNNPVNWTDPSGLAALSENGALARGLGAAAGSLTRLDNSLASVFHRISSILNAVRVPPFGPQDAGGVGDDNPADGDDTPGAEGRPNVDGPPSVGAGGRPGASTSENGGLPGGLVGSPDDRKPTKGRVNSGPLAPENGGTGDPNKDFDILTGGKEVAPHPGLSEGSRQGANGVVLRPGNGTKGPRIDIPANSDTGKPRETLHF